ncbi:MAG: hypothetical protein RQ748_11585 [Elusimicrobiales bacterium]|nr:hypothetical protein [Elusimicrobiales bacterium]
MNNNHIAISAILCFAAFQAPAHAEMKITPVMNISLLGGKYHLDEDAGSFQGRADAFVSPHIRLSENQELLPVYIGNYSGTQDIQELAGGGVLTRQRQNHSVSLKYVYTRDFNKYKPRISYSKALVRETKDEDWGDGLFDYGTVSVGFEAEQERPHGTYTQSYDYFQVRYPNYSTLLSNSQTVIDTTTFNELSRNAGTDTMDNDNHRLAFGYTWFPEPFVMTAGYDFTWRGYPDQAVVAQPATGSPLFKSDKRFDVVNNVTFRAARAIKPAEFSLAARLGYLYSNQNSYDSSRTKFIPDYYNYVDIGLSPRMALRLPGNAYFSFGVDYRRLYYTGRLVQDASGNYGSGKIRQESWTTSLQARYPIMRGFFARATYNYQISSSNMRYEAGYRYNYRASNYLLGIEWEF